MSFITNADSKVTSKDRAEDEKLMKIGLQIEKQIDETVVEGQGYKPVEFVAGSENVVTEAMLADVRKEEYAPVVPAGWEYDADGRVIWKLGPYHFEMVKQGKVCHACLEWQTDIQTTHCMWRGKREGCGAERGMFANTKDIFGRK